MLLLKNLAAQCRAEGRPLVFSLEMLNRDMQGTLDKYFADEISERDFLYACRDSGSLWPNYITDYRPLVNFCKEAGVRVVCANAPSFSLRVVGQEGPDGLQRLSAAERELLPSLPYPPASKAYRDKMAFINKESPHGFSDRLMEVQALWDASMAGSVLDAIKPGSGGSQPFCVHVCGRLHVEDRMGVLSQLDQSGRSVGCLLIYPSRGQISGLSPKEFKQLPISSRGGDFVALTDLNLARTFR
ncbi:unnamed protein product [Pedinophyceae sp. YPF-701]|nr:unnamed protein product [Pedinophyceae sp. YPF-701]